MIGQGMHGFVGNKDIPTSDIKDMLVNPTDMRIFIIAQAFKEGLTVDEIYELSKIDKWFLVKLKNIFDYKYELQNYNSLEELPNQLLLDSKNLVSPIFKLQDLF